jgi:hypothetical protein
MLPNPYFVKISSGKSSRKMRAASVIFKIAAYSKHSSSGRKFANLVTLAFNHFAKPSAETLTSGMPRRNGGHRFRLSNGRSGFESRQGVRFFEGNAAAQL